MSQKDYIAFARMIKARAEKLQSEMETVNVLTDIPVIKAKMSEVFNFAINAAIIFENDSYKFDSDKFLKACGVKDLKL